MKTMNMPGFTAEGSLYKTRGHYQTVRHVVNSSTRVTGSIYPAMVREDGIDCGNCLGGECAELHCFENWSHGGGDPGGPYSGGGGGGWGGGGKCTTDINCHFNCMDNVFHPCYASCVGSAGGNFGSRAFRACKSRCDASQARCAQGCKICH